MAYLGSLDDLIVAIIKGSAPIQFDLLLRVMERRVGCNQINESTLQRRLKGLRLSKRIRHNRVSPKGWTLTDAERTRRHPDDPDNTFKPDAGG